ncbi:MAG: phasin family protein [Novosphingobium sp.]|uniref:phasin family protein n=1 Tax=Novosphingobium sp. TaxID=1874826 RepID=UPI001825C6BE|nr:phasin family protein [Novosphingobium sp.]
MASAIDTKIDIAKAEAAAEKAYAAAAEQAKVTAAKAEAPKAAPAPKAAAAKAPVLKKAAAPKPAKKAKAAKPAAKPTVSKKTVKAAAAKPAAAPTLISKIKDTIMTNTTTEDFTAKVKDAVADAQDRAKVAFEKGNALLGDATEFTKGNVEALVETGKILAAGLQDMGKDYVAEGKTAIETVQADIKELAGVKSPADFFKLQGEILRRNFDAAVASTSKHSEAALKLAGDAFAPISTRVSVAIEKVKQAA